MIKHAARLWLTLRHRLFARHLAARPVMVKVEGISLVVMPQVFNPALFRTGEFLARTLSSAPLPFEPRAGGEWTALDMGTGTGIGAVFAARRGARVVAVDINLAAVRCAQANVLLNGFEDRIEVRHGDLFEPLEGMRFDLVLFNPPFYRGQPKSDLDRAWRSNDVLERFAAGLGRHLNPDGRALVVLSTDGEWQAALAALAADGFDARPFASRNFGNEIITVYAVKRRA